MAQIYFAILTAIGEAKLANAIALGTTLQLTKMAVGDGNGATPIPNRNQTALVHENRRAPLNTLFVDPANASQLVAEQIIPEDIGGWWIRELGLYDAAGDLCAVANCPDTYKPVLASGSGRTQIIRMVLIVANTAAVELKVDPSVVLAPRGYVDQTMAAHTAAADPHPQYATDADLASHAAAADPHPQYLTSAEGDAKVAVAVAALVASSPATLDTLDELAAALGDDPNFATTITNALAGKAALAGNGNQTFSVANGTQSQHAMALGQMRNKNPILNGGMDIAQRGTSFALQTAWKYGSLDRWAAIQANTAQGVLAQVGAGLQNFSYCAKLGRNNGANSTGFVGMLQALESVDSIPLQSKTCTLSFYAKAGANYSGGATFGATIWTGQGTDQAAGNYASWTNGASAGVTNPVLTQAWQRFTYQVAIPALATQLALIFSYTPSGVAGADDNIYITGVQLEPWPVATDFDRRPIQQELALCQRYYENTFFTNSMYNAGAFTGAQFGHVPFKVPKRAMPSVVLSGITYSNSSGAAVGNNTPTSISLNVNIAAAGIAFLYGNCLADAEL